MFSALAARDSPAATPSEMCPYRESDCNQEDIMPAGALYFLTSNNGSAEAQALSHFEHSLADVEQDHKGSSSSD